MFGALSSVVKTSTYTRTLARRRSRRETLALVATRHLVHVNPESAKMPV